MINDLTPNLGLPLPSQLNDLSDDVPRLRASLTALDGVVAAKADLVGGKVPAEQLPSYVDDVLEFPNLAAFPAAGETGKIYIAIDTGATYRWTGSLYADLGKPIGPATSVALGLIKVGAGLTVGGDGTLSAVGVGGGGSGLPAFTSLLMTPAVNGQTVFTPLGGYTAGQIEVYLNGVLLYGNGDDYTAADGVTITLAAGVTTADLVLLRRWAYLPADMAVNKTGDSMTGALNEAAAITLASGATLDVGTANANTINVTGAVGITSLGMAAAGVIRRLVFAGSLTITHNATSLILPGAVNITTAPGEVGVFLSLGGGNWRCVAYLYAPKPLDAIRTPSNASPAAGATSIGETPILTGSTYYSLYGIAMAASQWQVSAVADFATTIINTGDVAGAAVTYTAAAGVLAVSTAYYWRVRYKDADGVYSAWSAPTSFTTKANFNDYIATPTATPAAFGDPLEGGFYTGMVWNELVQTASSTTIGTGTKTFTVPNMTGSPIVYAGQQLEVRSRANPANKMVGTVTSAQGTALTLNVTSVGGSGTFTDWSIMSRYRVIVAPKASGENASIAYKNANTAAPAACGTLTEGRKATLAMVGADTSTVYPAAWWCSSLNIGGKTDWYLPARDELELCWRNLKPTTDANYATADRSTSATQNYANLGSYGDTANTHGTNNNSAPTGAAYTSGSPAQTAATAFRTGGAEAFAYGSEYYWSSTEYSASNAWNQLWYSSLPGCQSYDYKANAYRVRAVRRSII